MSGRSCRLNSRLRLRGQRERLMRDQALRARPRPRELPVDRGERSVIADNVFDRQFQAHAPNQKWVTDSTSGRPKAGYTQPWCSTCVSVQRSHVDDRSDLYSRRVVGWSMQTSMSSQLVADALMMAVWRRGRPGALLHHSDRVASSEAALKA